MRPTTMLCLSLYLASPLVADCDKVSGNRVEPCGFESNGQIADWNVVAAEGPVLSVGTGVVGSAVRIGSTEHEGADRLIVDSPCLPARGGEEVRVSYGALLRQAGGSYVLCNAGLRQYGNPSCSGDPSEVDIGPIDYAIDVESGPVNGTFGVAAASQSARMVVSCHSDGEFVVDLDEASATSCYPSTLCLHGDRFEVTVAYRTFGELHGAATATDLSDRAGTFHYVNPENAELLVKVLDGCAVNDRFWVFFAATTNAELELQVTDTWTGQQRSYHNPLGQAALPVQDTQAFTTCGASNE